MFIEGVKFKKLREAEKSGDEKAHHILEAYKNDSKDLDGLLNDYFTPVSAEPEVEIVSEIEKDPADKTGLEKFLEDNGVNKDSKDYEEYVNEYHEMFPEHHKEEEEHEEECECDPLTKSFNENYADEIEACEGYDGMIIAISNRDDIDSITKQGLIANVQAIKEQELEHMKKLKEYADSLGIEIKTE